MNSPSAVFVAVAVAVTVTVAATAWSHGLRGDELLVWTGAAAAFAALAVVAAVIEERVMPRANSGQKAGFATSLTVAVMSAFYAIYGLASDHARPVVLGLVGAISFACFAWFLVAQQRRRERQ